MKINLHLSIVYAQESQLCIPNGILPVIVFRNCEKSSDIHSLIKLKIYSKLRMDLQFDNARYPGFYLLPNIVKIFELFSN